MLNKLASHDNTAAGDYTENGIRVCGVCKEPKQKRIDIPGKDGALMLRAVPISCRCEREALEQEEEKERQKQFRLRMDELNEKFNVMDRAYSGYTFANDDRKSEKLSSTCRRYVEQWEKIRENNIGLLFYGNVGTGKSFYASAIVNALLERRIPAAITSFPRLLNLLQSAPNRQALIDHLQAYKLLVIDDLGVERDSSYAAEQVFSVIDARARSGLPLIVTTNMTMEELKKPPTMQYARIYDRVRELCSVPIKMTGESRRTGNAEVRAAIARDILRV